MLMSIFAVTLPQIAAIAGGWRGVRDALAKRDRFRKFLTKGRPNGVMLPYAGSGQKLRYYFLDLTIKTNRLSLGVFGRIFRVTTKTQCHQGYDRKPRSASAIRAAEISSKGMLYA